VCKTRAGKLVSSLALLLVGPWVGVRSATTTTTTGEPEADPDVEPPAEEPTGAMVLIMDASGSMNELDADGQPLIDGAKQALRGVVEALPDDTNVGLRIYGHRFPNTDRANGCQDTELIHPVQPLDRAAMLTAIDGYQALGFTPIGLSLEEALTDLPLEGPRSIVLVSDGEDTCAPPDPCRSPPTCTPRAST
jgi:Ca-activated chloride channel family protein